MTKWKMSLAAVTALLLISATGYAEDKSTENLVFDEVIVTATRTAAKSNDVPSSVQVITRQTIEEQGAQDLSDVLRNAVGIQLTHSSTSTGRESVSIRGFDSRFSMILVDGKRVASEIDQNYELNRIPLENIERIEIVRGPVSSLYGTEALGGVINIITKKSQKPSMIFTVGTSSYTTGHKGKDRNSFTYDSGDVGKTSFRVSASQLENEALFKKNGSTFEPYGTWKNINADVDYKLSKQETVNFSTGYSQESTYEYPSSATVKTRDYVERTENALSYTKKATDSELFLRFYQSVMDKSFDQDDLTTSGIDTWVRAKRTINVYEGRFTQNLNSQHRLTLGAEYRPETFRGTAVATGDGTFTAYNPAAIPKTQTQQGSTANLNYLATYVQDEWNISDNLLTVMSLRYDDSNKFESNLSPKFGLTYKIADNIRLKMNISQGFRSPTPNQLYQKAATQQGNPNLRSEKSHSYDIAIEKDWNKTSGKLTFFNNSVFDMIDLVTTTGTNKQYQNISKASIKGVEAELTQLLSDRLTWTNSYTYLDAINDVTQERLANRARHVFSSGVSYHNLKGLTANLQAQTFISYLASPGGNKSYSIVNLAVSQKLSDHHKVMISVDNIFNRIDEDVSLPGTCIHGSIQYSF